MRAAFKNRPAFSLDTLVLLEAVDLVITDTDTHDIVSVAAEYRMAGCIRPTVGRGIDILIY